MAEEVEVTVTESEPETPEYSPPAAHAEIMGALGGISAVASAAHEEAKRAREIAEEAKQTAESARDESSASSETEAMAEIAVDAAIIATDAAADAAQAAAEAEEVSPEITGLEAPPPADTPASEDTPPEKKHWLFRKWGS